MTIERFRPNRITEAQQRSDVLTAAKFDRDKGRGDNYYLNLAVQNASRELETLARENRGKIRLIG